MGRFEEHLFELMQTSESITNFIIGQKFIDGNMPIDAMYENYLLNRCYEKLINLLEDEGIVIHVDLGEIVSDFHTSKFLITLYKTCSGSSLYNLIRNDENMLNRLSNILSDFNDNELILEVMKLVRDYFDTQTYKDMYVHLHDKIKSTSKYKKTLEIVVSTLEDDFDNPYVYMNEFMKAVIYERNNISKRIDKLIEHGIKIDTDNIELIKNKLLIELLNNNYFDTFSIKYLSILSNGDIQNNTEIDSEFYSKLDLLMKNNPNYIEYFLVRDSVPEFSNYIFIILTAIGFNNIFNSNMINIDDILISISDSDKRNKLSEIYSLINT